MTTLFKCVVLAAACAAVFVVSAQAVRRRSPTVTSVTALGGGQVQVDWTGVNGPTARIKRDTSRQGYQEHIYDVPNTGTVTLTGQPLGDHTYRVCDISTASTVVCSYPVLVTVT